MMALNQIGAEFRVAMSSAGIELDGQVIADGRIHAFHVCGEKRGSRNGRYALFTSPIPAGWFGTWRDGGRWHNWSFKRETAVTDAERKAMALQFQAARDARIREDGLAHEKARARANNIWAAARGVNAGHPYLVGKNIKPFGIRQLSGRLVIPLRDPAGIIWSLQFIDGDGSKRFLSGGRKRGLYHPIGVPTGTVCVAEGYATAASVHQATGHATAVAFDAGNLEPVARALRFKFPSFVLIIAADNDAQTPGNPGLSKAVAAAQASGALIAWPEFSGVCHG